MLVGVDKVSLLDSTGAKFCWRIGVVKAINVNKAKMKLFVSILFKLDVTQQDYEEELDWLEKLQI